MFYNQLIKLCEEHNIKPSPVLKELGLSSGNLKRWESGSNVNYDTLQKLSEYFDVPIDYFFENDEPDKNMVKSNEKTTIKADYWDKSKIKFGERIRTVRKNAGCNQKEFCSLLDIPQSTLSAYETDKMQPTVITLINIARKCNVSLNWLCGLDNKFILCNEGNIVDDPPPHTIRMMGKNFTADIPAEIFSELLTVFFDIVNDLNKTGK